MTQNTYNTDDALSLMGSTSVTDNPLAIIFDVETTGLLPRTIDALDKCPYVLQLSYAIFDIKSQKVIKTFNSYVKVAPTVEITEFIANLNHCSREKCNRGKLMEDILEEFLTDFSRCNFIVAHNFEYDSKMVCIEAARNKSKIDKEFPFATEMLTENYCTLNQKTVYCTMKHSIELCKLPFPTPRKQFNGKKDNYKFPKLEELHKHLYPMEQEPTGLHDSMIDVLVCLRCFMKLKYDTDVWRTY